MSKYGVFSGRYFPVFELNTGKYGPEKTPYLDTFHAVHPSILIKKHKERANSSFVFEIVIKEKIEKLVTNLNIRKTVQSNDIPIKLVKDFGYLLSKYIATSINRCIAEDTFINAFKKVEVRPTLEKRWKNMKVEL